MLGTTSEAILGLGHPGLGPTSRTSPSRSETCLPVMFCYQLFDLQLLPSNAPS
jgi:hypothetical protein